MITIRDVVPAATLANFIDVLQQVDASCRADPGSAGQPWCHVTIVTLLRVLEREFVDDCNDFSTAAAAYTAMSATEIAMIIRAYAHFGVYSERLFVAMENATLDTMTSDGNQ